MGMGNKYKEPLSRFLMESVGQKKLNMQEV